MIYLLLFVLFFIVFSFSVWFILYFSAWLFGAPYVPTMKKNEEIALEFLAPCKKVADLGSGDGRILIALAKRGIDCVGFETNPLLVWWSRRKMKNRGLHKKANIYWKNFNAADLRIFDGVYVFGIPTVIRKLEKKIQKELPESATIVTCGYHFTHIQPVAKKRGVWLYKNQKTN